MDENKPIDDELLDRLDQGDTLALTEIIEQETGAKAESVKVTLPTPTPL